MIGLFNYQHLNVVKQTEYELFKDISDEEDRIEREQRAEFYDVLEQQTQLAAGQIEMPTNEEIQEQFSQWIPAVHQKVKQSETVEKSPGVDVEWANLCSLQDKLIQNCHKLPRNWLPMDVREAVKKRRVAGVVGGKENLLTLERNSFFNRLRTLLFAEEIHESIELRRYDKLNDKIKMISDPFGRAPHLFEVRLPGLSKGQPSLVPTDKVVLEHCGVYKVYRIVDIDGDRVIFHPSNHGETFNQLVNFNVSFVSSGTTYNRYHDALETVSSMPRILGLLFETETDQVCLPLSSQVDFINVKQTASKKLDQRLLYCNDRQRQAVLGILRAWCRPKPYIIFGPPGTGKTFTLVESIVQIFNRKKGLRMLVCANSNNCADLLAQLIDETKLVNSMQRYNSMKHYNNKFHLTKYDTCEKKGLDKFRVIVTTNNLAANLKKMLLFDYVFVDEAGHAHEAETLIPIQVLKPRGCLVLAGDPKQLGPVIHSYEVERLGLGRSMLERLFQFKVYSRNGRCEGYDEDYITKLILSYRCDPRILELCNKLFYHDELRCLGRCPEALLEKLSFAHPLVFHSTMGVEAKTSTSLSRFNDLEANQCVDYVIQLYEIGLKPHQIGVISPYLLQKEVIKTKLSQKIRSKKFLNKLQSLPRESVFGKPCEASTPVAPLQESAATNRTATETITSIRQSLIKDTPGKENVGKKNVGKKWNKKKKQETQAAQESRVTPSQNITNWMCQIDTVDAFQGEEREVIIISAVRTPGPKSDSIKNSGFLSDQKRFNVAISRAKWLVIVVGHPAVLKCHKSWTALGELAFKPTIAPRNQVISGESESSNVEQSKGPSLKKNYKQKFFYWKKKDKNPAN